MARNQTESTTQPASEIDNLWGEATAALDRADKAKAKAARAMVAVQVAHESLTTAVERAAGARLEAEAADKHAQEAGNKARAALESHLNLPSGQPVLAPAATVPAAPPVPVEPTTAPAPTPTPPA